ncbi:MAG: glycerophosphodiester phosphodiesterase family protein [Solirubrobacterales bacterium]
MLKRSVICVVLASVAFAGLSAPALAKTKIPPWRQSPPLNIAHQGGEDEFPSNTMFAFKEALRAGAEMLELDIVVTKDNQVIVMHDTTVDSKTNSTGLVSELTLAEIRKLDGAYWFSKSSPNYDRNRPASAYVYRGVATGQRKPPKGYKASDFRVTTLKEVLKAFPKTPINIEIKGRTKAEKEDEYVYNAEVLGNLLKNNRRKDLIVVSFRQGAVDRFHAVAPQVPLAPGSSPLIGYFLENKSLGEGVVAVQVPMTYLFNGARIDVLNPAWVAKTHADGLAWHSWFDGPDVDGPEGWTKLVERCVDGIMTSKPRALERFLKKNKSPSTCRVK